MQIDVLSRISEIPASRWDALVPLDDPFSEHAFLEALEHSGSVGAQTGWAPCHLALRDGAEVVAVMPLYAKMHSYGEYIFDWGWAEAASRARIRYYPKLLSAVPFTPVTGGRALLGGPVVVGDPRVGALRAGARAVGEQVGASSLHVLFCSEAEQRAWEAVGAIGRLTYQFHWENAGYESFDHWLSFFRAKERKKVHKERELPHGVSVREIGGADLTDAELRALYGFYRDTTDRKGGYDYLNLGFFEALRRPPLSERVVVFAAERAGDVVSAALCFQKGMGLYGRVWGCKPGFQGLHFELCYHRPIARCIASGLRRFEAGAQGIHKLKRGLMPSPTFSAHWLNHPGLRAAVADAVAREATDTRLHMAALAAHGPFRRDEPPPALPAGPDEATG